MTKDPAVGRRDMFFPPVAGHQHILANGLPVTTRGGGGARQGHQPGGREVARRLDAGLVTTGLVVTAGLGGHPGLMLGARLLMRAGLWGHPGLRCGSGVLVHDPHTVASLAPELALDGKLGRSRDGEPEQGRPKNQQEVLHRDPRSANGVPRAPDLLGRTGPPSQRRAEELPGRRLCRDQDIRRLTGAVRSPPATLATQAIAHRGNHFTIDGRSRRSCRSAIGGQRAVELALLQLLQLLAELRQRALEPHPRVRFGNGEARGDGRERQFVVLAPDDHIAVVGVE